MTDTYENMIRPEADYYRFLGEGKFMLLRARASDRYIFHPKIAEPLTGDTDLEWVEASGVGTVYSTSVMREKNPADNYNIALIDLREGPRMMSRVEGIPPEEVRIGMKVLAHVTEQDGKPLLVFNPA